MRNSISVMLLAAALLTPGWALADDIVVTNYLQGFEGYAGTDQMPPGWEVVADMPEGSVTTFKYVIEAAGGQQISRQNSVGLARLYADATQPNNGSVYLVTPPVKGKVKFAVKGKSWSYKGPIQMFKMVKNADGALVAGDELTINGTVFSSSYSWDSDPYVEVTDYCRIGIKMSNGSIDNIIADEALVPGYYGIMIENSTFSTEPYGNINADANGHATFQVLPNVLNYGTLDVTEGIENYTMKLVRNTDDMVVCDVPITETIPAGTGKKLTIDMSYDLADPTQDERSVYYKLREGLFGTETSTKQMTFKAYIAKLEIKDGTSSISKDAVQRLGLMRPGFTKSYNLANVGTAPLEITALNLPEGVTCAHELPFTIEAGQTEEFTFSFNLAANGVYEGSIGITHNGLIADSMNELRYMLAFADDDTYAVDFTDGWPAAWLNGEGGKNFGREQLSGNYYLYTDDNGARVVTPKITFAEGEHLTFGGARTTSSPYKEQYITVSYSPDRVTWTEALNISSNHNPTEFDESTTIRSLKYFSVDAIPAGDWYIAFESKCGIIDDVFGGKLTPGVHDVTLDGMTIPASGMVNYPVKVKADVRNLGPVTEAAGSYTLTLMSGDKVLDRLEDTPALPYSINPVEFEFSFTPHEVMDAMPLHVVLNMPVEGGEDINIATDPANIQILPEAMISEVPVGELTTNVTTGNVPMFGTYNNSISETVYTADQLGLAPGSVINKLTFYYVPVSKAELEPNIKIWLDNTTGSAPVRPEDMTTVFADTVNMVEVHHSIIDLTVKAPVEVLNKYAKMELQFSQPFVYSGENLRMIMRHEATVWNQVTFAGFNGDYNNQQSFYFNKDDYNEYKHRNSDGSLKDCNPTTSRIIPCMTLGLVVTAPQVSGKVMSGDQPLENARVMLESGDVQYRAATDGEGAYSINVLQPSLEYTLTAAAPAHLDTALDPVQYNSDTVVDDIMLARNELSAEGYSVTVDEAQEGTLLLTWEPVHPGSMDESVTYTVVLDGEVKTEGLTECEYTLEGVTQGAHVVGVKAVFLPSMLESTLVEASADVTGLGTLTVNGGAIRAAEGGIEVTSAIDAQVRVVSASGRTVALRDVSAGMTRIDLPAGVYVVELRGAVTITRKVAVK